MIGFLLVSKIWLDAIKLYGTSKFEAVPAHLQLIASLYQCATSKEVQIMIKKKKHNWNWNQKQQKPCWDFLFKSQLSDRNALPFYIALKTPVVCMERKNNNKKKTRLQLQSNSFASGGQFSSCTVAALVRKSLRADAVGVGGRQCRVAISTVIIIWDKCVDVNNSKQGYFN